MVVVSMSCVSATAAVPAALPTAGVRRLVARFGRTDRTSRTVLRGRDLPPGDAIERGRARDAGDRHGVDRASDGPFDSSDRQAAVDDDAAPDLGTSDLPGAAVLGVPSGPR